MDSAHPELEIREASADHIRSDEIKAQISCGAGYQLQLASVTCARAGH